MRHFWVIFKYCAKHVVKKIGAYALLMLGFGAKDFPFLLPSNKLHPIN